MTIVLLNFSDRLNPHLSKSFSSRTECISLALSLDKYGDHWGFFFFFSYGFSMKLRAGIYHGSYDKSIDIKYAATSY